MCSIEEAWAGQTFQNHKVQSQSDLHRKYMQPLSNDPFMQRNTEYSASRKEPQSRMDNYGFNTKIVRDTQRVVPDSHNSNDFAVAYSNASVAVDNYGGISPRPSYMSVYDTQQDNNTLPTVPMPNSTSNRNNFNDLNQAFQVSPAVEQFMGMSMGMDNSLQQEDSVQDLKILKNKINVAQLPNNLELDELRASIQNILSRLDSLENEIHSNRARNMCDMVLYVLIGMLLAFILYSLMKK
jgi:hypothetical protein